MRPASVVAALACALALLAAPSASRALEPPNRNDPCSRAGRNTCGTLGVGYYREYGYGIRWFGDFRGAVPGVKHTFCVDLGFWYPSRAYRYSQVPGELRNRDGDLVPAGRQQRMAYAAWAYGRTSEPNRQAAVMLYVHSLMGDARPGEIAPAALGAEVASLYERIAEDASRFHGPYRIEATLPQGLVVGRPATATVRVLSAGGNALPDVRLSLRGHGIVAAARTVATDASGVARIPLTAAAGPTARITVATEPLPTSAPAVYAPTVGPAVRNGQRLIAPMGEAVTDQLEVPVAKTRLSVTTLAVPRRLAVGGASRDRVTIAGPLPSWHGTLSVGIFGPFRSLRAIRCDGQPIWKSRINAVGPGVFTTPAAPLTRPGWYTYQEVVPEDASQRGAKTPCGVPSENVRVEAQPEIRTIVSADRVEVGAALTDRVFVEGLSGETATVRAELFGPFATREAITCGGAPIWTGFFEVSADGEYRTQPFTVKVPGYYAYRETIAARGFVRSTETDCAETAETAVAVAKPRVRTKVNRQRTHPGGTVVDRVIVSGLGPVAVRVSASLWGPFPTRTAIRCSGTPYWSGSFLAKGSGTYTTAPVRIEKAGYYVFSETIAAGPANEAFTAPCPDAAETTMATATPAVATVASAEVVFPGARIFDRIRLRGLGGTAAAIDVELFGPFASLAAVDCTGTPIWHRRIYARGDGIIRTPSVPVAAAGFYTWREQVVSSPLVATRTTPCGLAVETTLARPEIVTGRGDVARYAAAPPAGGRTPVRVALPSVGLDAPVFPAAIDVANGVLGVPAAIGSAGWWRDGVTPGAKAGAVLIAGHVDSATKGAGAFFHLREAKAGDRVEIRTADGRTFRYRVISVRNYPKRALPVSVYSRRGRPRLVLVTCGGPFDSVSGHYRDNVVVTAIPA